MTNPELLRHYADQWQELHFVTQGLHYPLERTHFWRLVEQEEGTHFTELLWDYLS